MKSHVSSHGSPCVIALKRTYLRTRVPESHPDRRGGRQGRGAGGSCGPVCSWPGTTSAWFLGRWCAAPKTLCCKLASDFNCRQIGTQVDMRDGVGISGRLLRMCREAISFTRCRGGRWPEAGPALHHPGTPADMGLERYCVSLQIGGKRRAFTL